MKKRKQTLGIKSLRYAAFAVCMCALTLVQFSCKDPNYIEGDGTPGIHADIVITLKSADPANVKLKRESISVLSNLEWSSIKSQAQDCINLLNGAEFDKWTLTPEPYAAPISSKHKFMAATTIYAHAKPKIEVTIKTDSAKADINGSPVIRVKQNALWQDILPSALSMVEAKDGFFIEGWYEGESADASKKLTPSYSFTQNTSVYANMMDNPIGEVNIIVTGDSNIEISEVNNFNVPKDSLWEPAVKQKAEEKAKPKKGYKIKEWRLVSAHGAMIGSDSKFSKSTVVYALSVKDGSEPEPKPEENRITVAVLADIHQVEIKGANTFEVKKGSPWTEVKKNAEKLVKAKPGFKLTGWKLGSASGEDIADAYVFNENPTIVYAVSAPDGTQPQPKDMIDILVRCDTSEGDILAPSKITVAKGTKWKEAKVAAAKLVKVKKSGASISGWKKGSAGGAAINDEDLINENNFVAYAVITGGSGPAPQPETVTVIVIGDSNVNVNTNQFTVAKGSKWGQIKTRAQGCISFKNGATLKEWRRNASNGAVLQDSTEISPSPFTVFAVTNTSGGGGGGTTGYTVFFDTDPYVAGGGTVSARIKGQGNFVSGATVPAGSTVVFTADPNHNYFVEYWTGVDSLQSNYGEYQIEVVINKSYDIKARFIPSYFEIDTNGTMWPRSGTKVTENRLIIPNLIGKSGGDIAPKRLATSYYFYNTVNVAEVRTAVMARSEITVLHNQLFYAMPVLEKVTLPNNITSISNMCFRNSHKLHTINLPASLQTIGESAFNSCYDLKDLLFPSGLKHIGASAFYGVKNHFKQIVIPNSVQSIGANAFYACIQLKVQLEHTTQTLTLGTHCFGNKNGSGSCCQRVFVKNETIRKKVADSGYYDGFPNLVIK